MKSIMVSSICVISAVLIACYGFYGQSDYSQEEFLEAKEFAVRLVQSRTFAKGDVIKTEYKKLSKTYIVYILTWDGEMKKGIIHMDSKNEKGIYTKCSVEDWDGK